MKIEILGTGCAKCSQLAAIAEDAAKELGSEFELEKVTNLSDIAAYGVMVTPALVVDGKVKSMGKLPGREEMKELLQAESGS